MRWREPDGYLLVAVLVAGFMFLAAVIDVANLLGSATVFFVCLGLYLWHREHADPLSRLRRFSREAPRRTPADQRVFAANEEQVRELLRPIRKDHRRARQHLRAVEDDDDVA